MKKDYTTIGYNNTNNVPICLHGQWYNPEELCYQTKLNNNVNDCEKEKKIINEQQLHKLACEYDDSIDIVAMKMVDGEFSFVPEGIVEAYKAGYRKQKTNE